VEFCSPQTSSDGDFSSPRSQIRWWFFGPPSPKGLGRFVLCFFSSYLFVDRKTFQRSSKVEATTARVVGSWDLVSFNLSPFFDSRSTKFHRPQFDTRPLALLAAAFWSSRGGVTAEMIVGAWCVVLTCQGVFIPWSRVRDTPRPFCRVWWLLVLWGVLGVWRVMLDGGACTTRTVTNGSFSNGCFLVFYRFYLTVCSVSDYSGLCFVHRLYDRLHSANSSFYVIADASFCWLSLFVANVGMILVFKVTVTGYL
jgi:hypothetical protein